MNLTFVKRSGKFDDLTIARADGTRETIQCPKQGIIPHDTVHYAVESVLAARGFLSLVSEGQSASFGTSGHDDEEAIERLVETCQAEMWGGRVPAPDFIAAYENACAARGNAISPVSLSDVAAVRARLDALTQQWADVAINDGLTLSL